MKPAGRWVRRGLPVVVSAAALAALLTLIEPGKLLAALSWRVALVVAPALVTYGVVTLVIEALSLRLLVEAEPGEFGAWTAARIRCASYLLAIVHYTLGVAALTVLLRRRAGSSLAESASVVLLISSTDLVVVLTLAALGSAFVETGGALRAGVLALVGLGFFGGLALVRAPGTLGPLERIRSLAVFDALRRVAVPRLAQLLALRTVFTCSFIAVCGSVFYAFDIMPPLGLLVAGILIVAVVATLPIAVAGLGTSQLAVVAIFGGYAEREVLVAASLVLSAGLVSLRALMGFVFAREFTREALAETRSAPA